MPVPSSVEYSEAGLVIVVFMGLAQAQRRRAHITVDIFSARFTGMAKDLSVGIAIIGAILFFGFVAWRSGLAAWESVFDRRTFHGAGFVSGLARADPSLHRLRYRFPGSDPTIHSFAVRHL